jgi:hypothetical protein
MMLLGATKKHERHERHEKEIAILYSRSGGQEALFLKNTTTPDLLISCFVGRYA